MSRTITTAAELDALPVGSVVRGTAFEYGPAATIYVRQEEFWHSGWGVDEEAYFDLPVVVLHDPSAPVVPAMSDAAAPSATRDEVVDALVMTRLSDYAGTDMAVITQAADALLARFTITPKEDR